MVDVTLLTKMDEQVIDSLTESSFSAVGLFFGFLVRDNLTKLWKVGDLREQDGLV